jgi:RND superfamily putative drug exporter
VTYLDERVLEPAPPPGAGSNHPNQRGIFAGLGRWAYRRRWLVVAIWVAVAVVGGGLLGAIGTDTRTEFTLPDVESRRGTDILDEHFGGQGAGASGTIVFTTEAGVTDPAVQDAMSELFDEVGRIDGVLDVASPYEPDGAQQISSNETSAGRIAYATVELPSDISAEDAVSIGEDIREAVPDIEGLDVQVGGMIFAEFEEPTAELVGIAFAILILIVAFGSVLAMGLPIGLGIAGIAVGTILAGFVSHIVEVPEFAQMLGIMIGLGVGIDYALFIVTRFRENRHNGQDIEQSIVTAINTAGRATVFAGFTVVISLLGMLLMQLGFITGMAISAATVVAVTMIGSVTLLPALIGFVGTRIETTRWRGVIASGLVALALLGVAFEVSPLMLGLPLAVIVLLAGLVFAPLKRELPKRRQRPTEQTLAYRWSRLIQHRPWPAALAGVAVLVVLALPIFGLRLGFSDEGNYPAETETRQAYDLTTEGFGPGFNGPLMLASELPAGTSPEALEAVTAALRENPGIAGASDAILNAEDPADATAVMWRAFPTTAPQDEATTNLVNDLRDDILPAATDGSGLDIAVTGTVAANIDFSDYLSARMPLFLLAVLALSFLLLMAVFRSVLVPLKAVIMNLLGIGAAYGIIIAGFQWGWAGPLLNVDSGPIEPFMPMMLFAIVFGLSMDYEVFLLSRVKEEWDRTGDSHTSVANGLAATARVITAAALIMVVVFGAFMLGDDRVIKMAGLGLAAAVLLDATIIRMLLVPATMELLGDRNWWLPRWLDRILPSIDVEGHGATEATDLDIPDDARELEPEPV